MTPNPYTPPESRSGDSIPDRCYAKGACPVCGTDVSNWTVINVAWRYRCKECGAKLSIEIESRLIRVLWAILPLLVMVPLFFPPMFSGTAWGLYLCAMILLPFLSLYLRSRFGVIAANRRPEQP